MKIEVDLEMTCGDQALGRAGKRLATSLVKVSVDVDLTEDEVAVGRQLSSVMKQIKDSEIDGRACIVIVDVDHRGRHQAVAQPGTGRGGCQIKDLTDKRHQGQGRGRPLRRRAEEAASVSLTVMRGTQRILHDAVESRMVASDR